MRNINFLINFFRVWIDASDIVRIAVDNRIDTILYRSKAAPDVLFEFNRERDLLFRVISFGFLDPDRVILDLVSASLPEVDIVTVVELIGEVIIGLVGFTVASHLRDRIRIEIDGEAVA